MIPGIIRHHKSPPINLIHHLLEREAILWCDNGFTNTASRTASAAAMFGLPWRLVLSESKSGDLASLLDQQGRRSDSSTKHRGYVSVVASDPSELQLPPRSLPIFFLNGRDDHVSGPESSNLGSISSITRRMNSIKRLIDARPRVLVFLTNNVSEQLREFKSLWDEEGIRSQVVLLTEQANAEETVSEWVEESKLRVTIDIVTLDFETLSRSIVSETTCLIPDESLTIRVVDSSSELRSHDVSECELIENPILDRYDLVLEPHLRSVLPDELREESLNAFFDRSSFDWAPFASGLPWNRCPAGERSLLGALRNAHTRGTDENRLIVIVSEPGAGGTTLCRQLAFAAAKAGYPTLVAKQVNFRPQLTEISRFMFRVHKTCTQGTEPDRTTQANDISHTETPWVIAFDVQHWRGRETDLLAFVRGLSFEGRPAIVIAVAQTPVPEILQSASTLTPEPLSHQLDRDQVLSLGAHLNKYLRVRNRDRSNEEWTSFWQTQSPRIGAVAVSPSSFWVALVFWLKKQVNLDETIQSWLYDAFKSAEMSSGVRKLVLQIAALGVERLALPQELIPSSPDGEFPYTYVLSELRRDVPALGLVELSTSTNRYWGIAHALLSRYLVNSAYRDRKLLADVGLESVKDSVDLRLALVRDVVTRGAIARPVLRSFALEIATNVLKLDRDSGNSEFFRHWKEVLSILEDMPDAIWDESRTFNHHVAVSRRRVAIDDATFLLTLDERREQLRFAIEDLEFAIREIPKREGDERDLNLMNSVARAYQDLANIEEESGADRQVVARLRKLATDFARSAFEEDPSNSFVLETIARDLIQAGRLFPESQVEHACNALNYIFRAMSLESAPLRQERLKDLIVRAIALLSDDQGLFGIEELINKGNSLGYLARASVILGEALSDPEVASIQDVPLEVLGNVLSVIRDAPEEGRSWPLLRLEYDVLAVFSPLAFSRQLEILDELEGSSYRLTAQEELDRSILLHQLGRHQEGNDSFFALRRRLQATEALIRVPDRLRVLKAPESANARVCEARVIAEPMGYRGQAEIFDLNRAKVPFVPQDWGIGHRSIGTRFKCSVIFGPKGPMAKPPMDG